MRAGRPAAVPAPATGHDLDRLRSRFSGRVITAADGDYDQARSVWNGAIDAHPAVIARCAGPGDAAAAVRFAQDAGLEISVRGGAHSFAGAAVGDGGLTIDLSGISQVTVDPDARTAGPAAGPPWPSWTRPPRRTARPRPGTGRSARRAARPMTLTRRRVSPKVRSMKFECRLRWVMNQAAQTAIPVSSSPARMVTGPPASAAARSAGSRSSIRPAADRSG